MIEQLLELLSTDDFLGRSEAIDIAKGKYKIPSTFKEIRTKHKRKKAWLSKKQ